MFSISSRAPSRPNSSDTLDSLLQGQERRLAQRKRRLSESSDSYAGENGVASSASSSDREESKPPGLLQDWNSDPENGSTEGPNDREKSSIMADDRITSLRRITKKSEPSNQSSLTTAQATFASLGVSLPLQKALKGMSIKVPTEVQAACVPPLLAGRDCIGNAKTGSGKTIAFALPILQRLSIDPYGIFAMLLTPTRELAFQISEQFAVLGAPLNIRTAVVVGGMDMMAQALELGNRPHIVIATPGRIVDHLKSTSREWDLSRVKFLVLDEADRLLTSSFTSELSFLFNLLPRDRQTCLFTATITPSIESLADDPPKPGKEKPFVYRTNEVVETVSTLKQHYILVPSHVREVYLYYILCNPPESTARLRRAPPKPRKMQKLNSKTKKAKGDSPGNELEQPPPTIIFCAKPRTAAYLTSLLKTLFIRSTALHSRLTQRERLASLSLFRAYVVPVLISTDVGARGLDIEDVAMVINWDLPSEPEEYTHRVGRTARAGKGGVAISFVTERDEERLLGIEGRIRTKLEEMSLPEDKVLGKLNAVSTAKRLSNMELHDSNFGKREDIHKIKSRKGGLPDQEDVR